MKAAILAEIEECIMDGDGEKIAERIQVALDEGLAPNSIVDDAMLPGMSRIGRLFRDNEVYVPDVILAADAMQTGLGILRPLLSKRHSGVNKRIVIGTVKNDLHDLGKTIVICSLTAAGFDVIDLGVDVPAEDFIEALETEDPYILALSCTLSFTLEDLRQAVASIRKSPKGQHVKIIVGGLSVTPAFATEIDANYYSVNSDQVVLLVQRLLHEQV